MFEFVCVNDQHVLGVTPRAELKLFFDLQYAGMAILTRVQSDSLTGSTLTALTIGLVTSLEY